MKQIQAQAPTSPPRSPFLPGTKIQFAWDSTSLGYLKTCPRLYQYIMIDGWGSEDESIHLTFGIHYHHALEGYARLRAEGLKHDEAVIETVRELLENTGERELKCTNGHDRCYQGTSDDCPYCEEKWVPWTVDEETRAGKYKNRHSLLRTVIDYLDHYRDDPAPVYIKKDGTPAVELSFNFELEWGPTVTRSLLGATVVEEGPQPYLLSGHLDRVVEFSGDLYVMDHKTTTSTVSPYYFAQWSPSNQMTLYTIASQIILGSPIKGVIIDATQILVSDARFVRGFTYRTPDQIDEWMRDLRYWLGMAEEYAAANYWPMNDTACDKFGGCRFREVCSKSPKVREQFLKSDFTKLKEDQRWNPLKAR